MYKAPRSKKRRRYPFIPDILHFQGVLGQQTLIDDHDILGNVLQVEDGAVVV